MIYIFLIMSGNIGLNIIGYLNMIEALLRKDTAC